MYITLYIYKTFIIIYYGICIINYNINIALFIINIFYPSVPPPDPFIFLPSKLSETFRSM